MKKMCKTEIKYCTVIPFFKLEAGLPFLASLAKVLNLEWQLCIFNTVFMLLSWKKNFLSTDVSFDFKRSLLDAQPG